MAAAGPLAADERAWAIECFQAGDPLEEIAAGLERDVLSLARELGLDRPRPRSLRWRKSGLYGNASPYVGRLLLAVAAARCRAGDRCKDVARDAGVHPTALYERLRKAAAA